MNSGNTFSPNDMDTRSLLNKTQKRRIEWIMVLLLLLGYTLVSLAQTPAGNMNDLKFSAESVFQPTIKDAVKLSDVPEAKDSVKRITNIKYGISSAPVFAKYEAQPIEVAKLQNEPLNKLYHSVLKVGYSPIYNMPYGEFWIGNTRSKELNYGAHLKHFSSTTHLRDVGYGGFSDNQVNVFGKKFYKKHSLYGDLNYERNVVHYYGYDTSLNKLEDKKYTRQRYQLFEPKIQVLSHYTDSTHINHNIQLSYYNLQNFYREAENNVRLNALGTMFINKEKFNLNFFTDYYNHKQSNDTVNDLIMSLSPSFSAAGNKWHANVGVTGTFDRFATTNKFYFYPQLNLDYDVYQSILIPYAGVSGALIKNSLRSLSRENPFVDTTITYANTSNKYNLYGGLRGNLSSSTSYEARINFAQYENLHFFVIDYSGNNLVYNQFNVLYDNASVLTLSGQLKYQLKEKLSLTGKGNYYIYKTKNLTRAYHKPDFDLNFSAIYNLQSKIILRADLFFQGKQWALSQVEQNGATSLTPKQLKGWADVNLEGEYRYSKMLSFFVRLNNLANQRYSRWERYPSQRFSFMLGLSFVPF